MHAISLAPVTGPHSIYYIVYILDKTAPSQNFQTKLLIFACEVCETIKKRKQSKKTAAIA